jgi:hypothetical protein
MRMRDEQSSTGPVDVLKYLGALRFTSITLSASFEARLKGLEEKRKYSEEVIGKRQWAIRRRQPPSPRLPPSLELRLTGWQDKRLWRDK